MVFAMSLSLELIFVWQKAIYFRRNPLGCSPKEFLLLGYFGSNPLIAAGGPGSFAPGQKNYAETDTVETTNT
jgi:hypothetical protein